MKNKKIPFEALIRKKDPHQEIIRKLSGKNQNQVKESTGA
jgi:hypothetical protein